jgi:hypothetical protein
MIRNIATETQVYQAVLEGHRAHPEDRALAESLVRAKAAIDAAWLEHRSSRTDRATR